MKVLIDNKIPFIHEAIEQIADEVIYLPGNAFTPEAVRDADALIIRTRTHCNCELLAGSRVKFIATATIGFDHIDTDYCYKAGITWSNAPGCNAASVAQYLQSTLYLLEKKGLKLTESAIGIVGVGNVGKKVAAVAKELGMRVLLNDPPRQAAEGDDAFCSLQQLAAECDVLTFHTPLNKTGVYKTQHLADNNFFHSLKKTPYIINTSRGDVVDTEALLQAFKQGTIRDAVIDVWEHEPNINIELLEKVYLGTPHIAGYSADGKANATRMALDALCRFFNLSATYTITPPSPDNLVICSNTAADYYLGIYDPRRDSEALKQHPELFEKLRGDYPLRREKEAYPPYTADKTCTNR